MKLETARTIARKARRDMERPGDLQRRIVIGALSLIGAGAMTAVSLLQTGVVSQLPDPLGPWFDSERVNLSAEAFRFGIPDGLIALGSYGLNIPLAIAGGGADRWRRHAGLSVLVALKAAADAAGAFKYTVIDMPAIGVACVYCIVAAGASFAIFGLSLPEAWAAIGRRAAA
jgi:uncharacterized membrane protein